MLKILFSWIDRICEADQARFELKIREEFYKKHGMGMTEYLDKLWLAEMLKNIKE